MNRRRRALPQDRPAAKAVGLSRSQTLGIFPLWLLLLVVAGLLMLLLWPSPTLFAQEEGAEGPTPPSLNPVISLASAPQNPAGLLAGTLNTPELSSIFRSADGGATWTRAVSGLRDDISIADIVYDPTNPNIVLAADGGFGYLFRSIDGGSNWAEVPAFKALIGPNSAVGELHALTSNGTTTFYAGTRFDGVLSSTDGGETWQSLATGLAGDATRVRSFQQFNGVMYAGTHDGIYALDPATSTWTKVANFPAATIAYSMAEQGGSLYVGTINSGLWITEDAETWSQVLGFPADASIYDLVSAGTGLVAATDFGVWSGSGEQWLQASVDGLPNDNAIYALTATDGTVYAGSSVDWVLRTDDRGFSFSSIANISPMASGIVPTVEPEPTATSEAEAVATPDETLELDVPALPADATVVAEEPVQAPTDTPTSVVEATPILATSTPLPATDTPGPAPTDTPMAETPSDVGSDQPVVEDAQTDAGSGSVIQLPPVVVGAGVLLLLVILIAGFSVLRGPRDV